MCGRGLIIEPPSPFISLKNLSLARRGGEPSCGVRAGEKMRRVFAAVFIYRRSVGGGADQIYSFPLSSPPPHL